MPVFEYTCKKCKKDCEILVRSSSQKLTCPACKSTKLEKKFSMFAAQGTSSRGSSSSCSGCASGHCSTCGHSH